MTVTNLTPRRPYFLRATYDWILDNNLTPYLVVDIAWDDVDVPMEFVNEGKIVLNIAPHAVGNFDMNNRFIQFSARFSGVPRQVTVPMPAILAIYARENGQGMGFEPEPFYEQQKQEGKSRIRLASVDNCDTQKSDKPQSTAKKPTFSVVK